MKLVGGNQVKSVGSHFYLMKLVGGNQEFDGFESGELMSLI